MLCNVGNKSKMSIAQKRVNKTKIREERRIKKNYATGILSLNQIKNRVGSKISHDAILISEY